MPPAKPMNEMMDLTHTAPALLAARVDETCWDDVADVLTVLATAARLNMSEPQVRRVVRPLAQEAMDLLRALLLDEGDR